jgi:hypothetical protein
VDSLKILCKEQEEEKNDYNTVIKKTSIGMDGIPLKALVPLCVITGPRPLSMDAIITFAQLLPLKKHHERRILTLPLSLNLACCNVR